MKQFVIKNPQQIPRIRGSSTKIPKGNIHGFNKGQQRDIVTNIRAKSNKIYTNNSTSKNSVQ